MRTVRFGLRSTCHEEAVGMMEDFGAGEGTAAVERGRRSPRRKEARASRGPMCLGSRESAALTD